MAFVRENRGENDEISFDWFNNGSDLVLHARVGYDDETNDTYALMVALSPQGGGDFELAFWVLRVEFATDEKHQYWNGNETKHLIQTRYDRGHIRFVLFSAVELLIREKSPEIVYHATHGANLPESALHKHHVVNKVFAENGYAVIEGETYHGRHLWILERLN